MATFNCHIIVSLTVQYNSLISLAHHVKWLSPVPPQIRVQDARESAISKIRANYWIIAGNLKIYKFSEFLFRVLKACYHEDSLFLHSEFK